MPVSEVAEKMQLHSLRSRKWHIQPASALTGKGLHEGLDWLSSTLAGSTSVSSSASADTHSWFWSWFSLAAAASEKTSATPSYSPSLKDSFSLAPPVTPSPLPPPPATSVPHESEEIKANGVVKAENSSPFPSSTSSSSSATT